MTRFFDMRRLHMGCGESLQPHLLLPVYGMRRQPVSTQAAIGREARKRKKTDREESR